MPSVMGAADKFFVYTSSGKVASQNIWLSATLTKPCKPDVLAEAFEKARKNFPEFYVKPNVVQNALTFENNSASAPLTTSNTPVRFVVETNGYPYVFRIQGATITFSFYHCISDVDGCWQFFQTILVYYASLLGLLLHDETQALRTPQLDWQSEKELDPYTYFADPNGSELYTKRDSLQFSIPEPRMDDASILTTSFELSLPELLAATRAHQTSVAPFFMQAFFSSVAQTYNIGDTHLLGMVAANLRQFFKTSCVRNFSDALFMDCMQDTLHEPFSKQAKRLKDQMNEQKCAANFTKGFYERCQWIKEREASKTPLAEQAQAFEEALLTDANQPFTLALSYPGILEVPKCLDGLVIQTGFGGNTGLLYAAGMHSYKDRFFVGISQRFKNEALTEAVISELDRLGLQAKQRRTTTSFSDALFSKDL